MLRKIKLYGQLAEFIGHKEFEVEVDSVSKAVSFLIHNFSGLEEHMSPQYYQVKVGNYNIDKNEINYPVGMEDIHFIPVIAGAGSGARKILLGAGLISLGILSGGTGFALNATQGIGFFGGSLAAQAANVGVGLTLLGVNELLFPLPKPQDFSSEEDPRLSFSFGGLQNTSRAGTPVPIVYGEIFTGSVVISAAIDNNQVEA
tara:strand:- start:873 stop:1478 length:606 start_codon:yes stop_codon:yes gene_type:complete